ncbi:hypothetical protein HU200_054106 [Digitaria exilis]|uniref:Uncharacterized protein n=1 Tax=Digitaria exilis TaxID=1010633 RepID=A0A835E5T4_9POAL|nr:hypothetical protein HU200_054106 [Digitaria exilis]
MTFNKNQVAACFTLALLVASSLGEFSTEAMAPAPYRRCYEWVPMVKCKSNDKMCLNYCLKKDSSYIGPVTACDAIGIDDAAWRAVNFGSKFSNQRLNDLDLEFTTLEKILYEAVICMQKKGHLAIIAKQQPRANL